MKKTVYQIPLVSTQHVSQEDFEWFENAKPSETLVFSPNDANGMGLFVYVDPEWYVEAYSPGVKRLFDWACKNEYEFIRLTPDGDTIEELPIYDW